MPVRSAVETATKSSKLDFGPGATARTRAPLLDHVRVAALLIDCGAPQWLERAVDDLRRQLPAAAIYVCTQALPPGRLSAVAVLGTTAWVADLSDRDALWRRLFAEIEADVYLLCEGACEAALAPRLVHEVESGLDFVNVRGLQAHGDAAGTLGERLLGWTVRFLFGARGGHLMAGGGIGFRACSRRYARSYLSSTRQRDLSAALALHALRLRLPAGVVSAPSRPPGEPVTRPRTVADRVRSFLGSPLVTTVASLDLERNRSKEMSSKLALRRTIDLLPVVGRLLIEERPRRVFGLLAMGFLAAGTGAALSVLRVHAWQASLPLGADVLLSLGLLGVGAIAVAVGSALDMLAKARQEVNRLGYLAIPRRAERT